MTGDMAKAQPGSPNYDGGSALRENIQQSVVESRTLLDLSHQADYAQYMQAAQAAQAETQSRQFAAQIAGSVVNLALSEDSWAQSFANLGLTAVYQAIPPAPMPTDPTQHDVSDQDSAYYNDVNNMAINLNNNGVLPHGQDAASFCADHPEDTSFVDGSGKIQSFDELQHNAAKRQAFQDWMRDQNSGGAALNPYLSQYSVGFSNPVSMGGDTAV